MVDFPNADVVFIGNGDIACAFGLVTVYHRWWRAMQGGPGITKNDLFVINKPLAPWVPTWT
jgi:Ni2+-binding GTPase involved in maturation of urease and hydrogenase